MSWESDLSKAAYLKSVFNFTYDLVCIKASNLECALAIFEEESVSDFYKTWEFHEICI